MSSLANFHGVQAVALHELQLESLRSSASAASFLPVLALLTTSLFSTYIIFNQLGRLNSILTLQLETSQFISSQLSDAIYILDALDNIEVNISGDDFNITLELGQLEDTARQILAAVRAGDSSLLNALLNNTEQTLLAASSIVDSVDVGTAANDAIFNAEDGWGDSVRTRLESVDDVLSAVSDTIDIISGVVETASAVVQGLQQATLSGILAALSGGAFTAKVAASVSELEWSLGAGEIEMITLEAEFFETAEVLLDACVSVLGEGPIECVGGEFAELAIELIAVEGLTMQQVRLLPAGPSSSTSLASPTPRSPRSSWSRLSCCPNYTSFPASFWSTPSLALLDTLCSIHRPLSNN